MPPVNGPQNDHAFEVTRENFQSEVIDGSKDGPVLLVFCAPQVPQSMELAGSLRQLASAYAGAFRLGLIDMSQDAGLAQAMRVQGVPSIRAVKDGQLAGALDGPQPESALRQLINELTMSSSEQLREQLALYTAREDYAGALNLVRLALQQEPNNTSFLVEFADLLALTGESGEARKVVMSIPESTEARSRVVARLDLMDRAEPLLDLEKLRKEYESEPSNSEACYRLAVKLAAGNQCEEALELGLTLLINDREFGEDAGRKLMLEVFELLGKGSGLAQKYRRKMFNFLH